MARERIPQADALRVAVLAGGTSAERAVSLESGAAVAAALARCGHRVDTLDPADHPLETVDWSRFDVAFLALHGTFGEDGQAQRILEDARVPYTGSDSIASRLAFSKSAAKERFAHAGVATPPAVVIHESNVAGQIHRLARRFGYPLVVKPDAQGSSLGVTICPSEDELPAALGRCFHYGPFGLLETMIAGTEWTVGLLDDLVLPAIRIETARGFFDYQAKYHDDETQYLFETSADDPTARSVRMLAFRAARALGTSGVARVDLRVDAWGQPWVLEVNTLPGMTSHSLIPKAAARVGLDFDELCDRALRAARERFPTLPLARPTPARARRPLVA